MPVVVVVALVDAVVVGGIRIPVVVVALMTVSFRFMSFNSSLPWGCLVVAFLSANNLSIIAFPAFVFRNDDAAWGRTI